MIDVSIYESLARKQRLELSPVMETYLVADGSELVTRGEVDIQLKVGGQLFLLTVVVAELGEHTAFLGLDFMEDHDVALWVGRGQMILGNQRVVLHRENVNKGCCRISMGKTLTIPPRSCMIVEADVDMRKAMHGKSAQKKGLCSWMSTHISRDNGCSNGFWASGGTEWEGSAELDQCAWYSPTSV